MNPADMLEFPEYAPDLSPFGGDNSAVIENVYPRKDGYGPAPSPAVFSQALPAQCRGMFSARNADGTITLFAATASRLWKLNATDLSWVPVSKAVALTSISNASPAVFTLTAHGLSIGDPVVLSTTGALPAGLTVGTIYYVATTSFGANSFKVSDTLAHALAGTNLIDTSSAGSGTHSFTGRYTALPNADQWQFAQFNNFVIAVQINVVPQVFNLVSSTAFGDMSGSPPQARYVSILGSFVALSGLGTSFPYRIQWSGVDDITNWTPGTGQSDFQDFPDGGVVRGAAGSEFSAIVFQDSALRRMTYVGGSLIFQFERISESKGLYAPYSLIHGGDRVFYIGNDGFQVIAPGGYPQAIGKERVDRTFFGDVDPSMIRLIIGTSDPKTTRVYWVYRPQSGVAGMWSRVLVYDYALDRWGTVIDWTGEYIATMAAPGLTLENLDAISGSIDALPFSLDDVSTGVLSAPAMFDANHKMCFFSGPNLEATLDTSEQGMDGAQRVRVRNFRPATDAQTVFGSIGARENLQTLPTYLDEQEIIATGIIPLNVSTRFARGRVRIPAGTPWTFIQGIEPTFTREGQR